MKLLVFDNYDSFTYNLVHLVEKILHQQVDVVRNNEVTLDAIEAYDKIILSPGPGIPDEAGLLKPLLQQYANTKSILGVCLGHQAIGEVFGGKLENLSTVYHGVATPVQLLRDENGKQFSLFNGLEETIEVGRYHSWIVSNQHLPAELEVMATDENGFIMAMRHRTYDVQGVQFHPESVLTPQGETIISNWLVK